MDKLLPSVIVPDGQEQEQQFLYRMPQILTVYDEQVLWIQILWEQFNRPMQPMEYSIPYTGKLTNKDPEEFLAGIVARTSESIRGATTPGFTVKLLLPTLRVYNIIVNNENLIKPIQTAFLVSEIPFEFETYDWEEFERKLGE